MSTLKVNSIQDTSSANTSTTAQIQQGRCKAWVDCNGGTATSTNGSITINNSFNVSSVTDKGVGRHRITFSSAMPNANLCPVFSFRRLDSNMIPHHNTADAKSASYIDVRTTFSWSQGGTLGDTSGLYVAIFGD